MDLGIEKSALYLPSGWHNHTFATYAAQNNHFHVLAAVMNKGVSLEDLLAVPTSDGKTPVHFAARHGSHSKPAMAFLASVLNDPARVETLNKADRKGWTPLHQAALKNDVPLLKLLLSDNQLNITDLSPTKRLGLFRRHSVLDVALKAGHQECVRLLNDFTAQSVIR